MPGINSMLILVLADLDHRSATASIQVHGGDTQRSVSIASGQLIGAVSNVQSERLGDMLVAEGKLDPVLLEPVAAEAARRQTLLGNQLVEDKLLTGAELAEALDRQLQLRFAGACATRGNVALEDKKLPRSAYAVPLGNAVLSAFRQRLALADIEFLLEDPDRTPLKLDLKSPVFSRLDLGPSELRICRRLSQGEALETMLTTLPREPVLRLAGALHALRLWS